MTESTDVDLRWIATCNEADAGEAVRILAAVLVQFDRGSHPAMIAARSNTHGGFMPPPDQHNDLVRWRQDVVLMLLRRRVLEDAKYLEGSRPDGECFVISADEALARRAHELFELRERRHPLTGELTYKRGGGVLLDWLDEIPTDILGEVRDLLEATNREIALGKTVIRVSPYPSEFDHHPLPIGQEDQLRRGRNEVAELLVRRGVLLGHRSEYVGGPNSREADRGDWLVIDADSRKIRPALEAVRQQLLERERYERMPQNSRAALPTPKWVGRPAGNITNYYGPTTISNVTGDHNVVQVTVNANELDAIAGLVREMKGRLNDFGLGAEAQREAQAEMATLEAQLGSPKPKRNIIRAGLAELGRILAGAAVGAAANPFIAKIQEILHGLAG